MAHQRRSRRLLFRWPWRQLRRHADPGGAKSQRLALRRRRGQGVLHQAVRADRCTEHAGQDARDAHRLLPRREPLAGHQATCCRTAADGGHVYLVGGPVRTGGRRASAGAPHQVRAAGAHSLGEHAPARGVRHRVWAERLSGYLSLHVCAFPRDAFDAGQGRQPHASHAPDTQRLALCPGAPAGVALVQLAAQTRRARRHTWRHHDST
mmetsp:Transcript_20216/g.49743  ORF Transcript_20216/g.49743 Transcript_20216/m.49743 type:complete len:208 (-) Transcript_20216:1434-2057(-)